MSNFFQENIECCSYAEILARQDALLVSQVQNVWKNVEYYRNKMQKANIEPCDIKSTKDIYKLPFLTKDDLRKTYPFGLFALPTAECVRIQATSGTTGNRVIAGYTQHDLDLWEDCVARALVAAGASREDICQIAYGYGLFSGGAGLHGGSHKLGCMTLPMSTGSTQRQLQFMVDLKSTILCCTPSYAAYLGECVDEQRLRDKINLKIGIFGGEPSTKEMIAKIEGQLGIKAYDIYGLTELSGPGVAFECSAKDGLHINEDHFFAEIIDPNTLEVLPDGKEGELVLTSLDKQAFPLLRYRTKDICILNRCECRCGRTLVRMSKPVGRSDDMLIIKGVNVFPSQIETVLMQNGCSSNSLIIVDRIDNTDTIEVKVELPRDVFTGKLSEVSKLERKLVYSIKEMLGIKVKVSIVGRKTLQRTEGKAIKVFDKRKF